MLYSTGNSGAVLFSGDYDDIKTHNGLTKEQEAKQIEAYDVPRGNRMAISPYDSTYAEAGPYDEVSSSPIFFSLCNHAWRCYA